MLKDKMQAMGMSIANAVSNATLIPNRYTDPFHQKIYIRDVKSECKTVKPIEIVDSAQVATATLHRDWLDITSEDVVVQKGRSNLFSSARAQKEKLEIKKSLKSREAFEKYYEQGEPRTCDH